MATTTTTANGQYSMPPNNQRNNRSCISWALEYCDSAGDDDECRGVLGTCTERK
jgi:hypothetical protein